MLLGGLMLPLRMLPDIAGKVARLLPASHAMNAFNSLAMGKPADFSAWGSVLVLFVGGVLAFALALFLFSWDNRNTKRNGSTLLALLALVPFLVSIFFK
jgi:ABC-type multidrug transport system permease subunit